MADFLSLSVQNEHERKEKVNIEPNNILSASETENGKRLKLSHYFLCRKSTGTWYQVSGTAV